MRYDLAIIGAGIMGLAHAIHAAHAGLKVAVFERQPEADGASVRNFGMLAIAAQAPGSQLNSARRALAHWQDIADEAGVQLRPAGCLFLARAPEEMSVLEECAAVKNIQSHSFQLLGKEQLQDYATGLRVNELLGGLWSPDAWKVDQRRAPKQIANWLRNKYGVAFHFSTTVHAICTGLLETTAGRFNAEQIILCGGNEFVTLFGEEFRDSEISHCQLQMLRTAPQPDGWQLKPFILGGLSIARYNVFADCPSLPALKEFQQRSFAPHIEQGIHVIACQETDGSITIGDSHAYGDAIGSKRSDTIDQLLLNELSEMIDLPNPQISERWMGHYAHLPSGETLVMKPADGITAITMTNGQGMTHSLALAEDTVKNLFA